METTSNIIPFDISKPENDIVLFLKLLEEVKKGNVRLFGLQETTRNTFSHTAYIVSFCYTTECQINNAWNQYNLRARGITFSVDFIPTFQVKLVNNPFPKCFNIEQIPFSKQEELIENIYKGIGHVSEKEDGSLIILYYHNYQSFIMSKGSFESDQAKLARKIWEKKYRSEYLTVDYLKRGQLTLLMELVGPSNKNVCRTKYSEDDLILLDVRYNRPFIDEKTFTMTHSMSKNDFNNLANKLKIHTPAVFEIDYNLIDNVKNEKDPNFEGVVYKLDINDDVGYKIKSTTYLELHKVLTGDFTYGRVLDIWYHSKLGKKLSETISNIPDEFYKEVNQMTNEIQKEFDSFYQKQVTIFYQMYQSALSNNRKTLAIAYPAHCYLLDKVFSAVEKKDKDVEIKSLLIDKFYSEQKRKKNLTFNEEKPNVFPGDHE